MRKRIIISTICALLIILIVGFFGIHLWNEFSYDKASDRYLNILQNNQSYMDGQNFKFEYEFDDERLKRLRDEYNLDMIAKGNTSFEKGVSIMNYFSNKLTHKPDFQTDYFNENSLYLLGYSIDNKEHGINCTMKSKILQEMLLSLDIKARRVWLMPEDITDSDCHVDVELYDDDYNKWILLDITNNLYFTLNDTPLSAVELRETLSKKDADLKTIYADDLKRFSAFSRWYNSYDKMIYSYYLKNTAYLLYERYNQFGLKEEFEYATIIPKDYDLEKYTKKNGVKLTPVSVEYIKRDY